MLYLNYLIKALRREIYKSGNAGTILMDLLKAYDCIPHDFLIKNFKVCGLHKISLNVLFDYLKKIVNIERKLAFPLALGLISGPLLFYLSSSTTYFFSRSNQKSEFH